MEGMKVLWTVLIIVAAAVLMGLAIAFVSKKFSVREDPRTGEVTNMLPGANCGGCGYPGCSGLAEALVKGEVLKVKTCKVSSVEKAQKIVDYLNSHPDQDGTQRKYTL